MLRRGSEPETKFCSAIFRPISSINPASSSAATQCQKRSISAASSAVCWLNPGRSATRPATSGPFFRSVPSCLPPICTSFVVGPLIETRSTASMIHRFSGSPAVRMDHSLLPCRTERASCVSPSRPCNVMLRNSTMSRAAPILPCRAVCRDISGPNRLPPWLCLLSLKIGAAEPRHTCNLARSAQSSKIVSRDLPDRPQNCRQLSLPERLRPSALPDPTDPHAEPEAGLPGGEARRPGRGHRWALRPAQLSDGGSP